MDDENSQLRAANQLVGSLNSQLEMNREAQAAANRSHAAAEQTHVRRAQRGPRLQLRVGPQAAEVGGLFCRPLPAGAVVQECRELERMLKLEEER